ncbi:hypothetical protein [Vibrio sp. SCSIO 43137]|uniref:hypothetical protein n=1 Tax=Vibrio sp. SCSIO 43137 TaxID=3021011 RepID=UPI002307423B|nr:hypothetical protein [Vibrio sp. SCSIO 43137]WCE31437.1 hypothetical protein PK654_20075 [Vibrio sp. SCSIO 43137]
MLRGIYKAKTSKNVVIYPLLRLPRLEDDFYWLQQISPSKNFLFKHHSRNDIKISLLHEAKNYNIGVIRGSSLADTLKENGFENVFEVTNGIQNVLKLTKNRIDLLASDELMLDHLIDIYNKEKPDNKLDMREFVKVSYIPTYNDKMYIAMGKNSV